MPKAASTDPAPFRELAAPERRADGGEAKEMQRPPGIAERTSSMPSAQHPTAGEIQRAIKPLPESTGRGLAMRTIEDMWRFAQYMAQSPFAPKGMADPRAIVVAIQMGAEIGLAPTVAVRSIAVINGRPSLWGDALLGLCQAHHSWDEAAFEETITETPQGMTARCTVRRKGGRAATREFSMEDAKRAGLASKAGTWQQYPKRMLQMRARSWALRDTFSDVLQGIVAREEAMDFVEVASAPKTDAQIERELTGEAALPRLEGAETENGNGIVGHEGGEAKSGSVVEPSPVVDSGDESGASVDASHGGANS